MSGSPSAIGSTSRHSSERVACSALSIPWISCSSSSSSRGLCLVLRDDAPANWSSVSLIGCLLCAGPAVARGSLLLLQGRRLVHRRPAALVALHLVLRLVLARPDRAAARLGVLGDLALDGALGLSAVALPR